MKEKEIVQTIAETDPEMKELWPLVEAVMDEIEALRLREPELGDKLDQLKEQLLETKNHSRRMLAFHKDVMNTRWAIESITMLEDTTRDNELHEWSKDWKQHTVIKLPDTEYVDYDVESGERVRRKRPTPGSTKKLAESVAKLKKRTAELMSIRKKTDPKLKVPLYKQVLDRLAGTSFTAIEGARVGYQVQLERGQRPTSSSARLRKAMDVQNFEGDQVLEKVEKGLEYDQNTGKYTLAKDYQLYTPEPKMTKEQLGALKAKYGRVASELAKLQEELGRAHAYVYHEEKVDPKLRPRLKEMEKVEADLNRISHKLTQASETSALKKVGLKRDDRWFLVPIRK